MALNQVTGLEEILTNLNKQVEKIQGRTLAGLWAAGLEVMALAKSRTPVLTGNLRGSGEVRKGGTRAQPFIELLFTAEYAIYVHENLEAYHKVGQAKFLESAIRDKRDRILSVIQQTARIK